MAELRFFVNLFWGRTTDDRNCNAGTIGVVMEVSLNYAPTILVDRANSNNGVWLVFIVDYTCKRQQLVCKQCRQAAISDYSAENAMRCSWLYGMRWTEALLNCSGSLINKDPRKFWRFYYKLMKSWNLEMKILIVRRIWSPKFDTSTPPRR